MRFVNEVAVWVVNLVLAGGLVWAVVLWRSRRRTAMLVALACGLELANRLGTWYGMMYVFGRQVGTPAFREIFGRSIGILSHLLAGASVVLLVFAALGPANRKP